MGIRTLTAVALLSLVPAAHACINSVGTDHTGRRFQPTWYTGAELVETLQHEAPDLQWVRYLAEEAVKNPSFANVNDIGVLLIRQGQYARAIRHFVKVESLFPGHAETAANLGTALELAGHDDVALRWIRIGIQRDPGEHQGSEWLHVRILEAKTELARDPDYLKHHSIAGVSFDTALVPRIPAAMPTGNDGKPVTPSDLNFSLSYQLHERLQFVAPRDAVVANLLMDWATLNLAGGPIENADVLYDLAVRYGAPRDALMTRRQQYIRTLLAKTASDDEPQSFACGICPPEPGSE